MSGIQRASGRGAIDHAQNDDDAGGVAAQSGAASASAARWPGAGALPGEKATKSGQYVLVDSKGAYVGKEKTISKGEPFPPARPGLSYKLVDGTKSSSETGAGGEVRGRPGEVATRSGQYELIGKNGHELDGAVTVVKGERFPPTPRAGQVWQLADATGTKRSGEKVEISGQYALVDASGKTISGKETTAVKGEKLPATPKAGQAWKLVDATRVANPPKLAGEIVSGEKAPRSGQYEIINKNGTRTGQEVTATKGQSMPPTPKAGQSYRLVDATNR